MLTAPDLITVAVFAVALLCLASLGFVLNGAMPRRQRRRLDALRRHWATQDAADTAASVLRKEDELKLGASLLRLLPRRHMLQQRLMKAGLSISPGRYAMVCVIVALCAGVMSLFFFRMPMLLGGVIAILAGVGLPHWFVGHKIAARLKKFAQLFPEAIDLMIRGIRSGLPVSETIASVGNEMADPVGTEFRRVTDSVKLGQSLDDALWDVARRLDTAEFKFFVISLSVQRETGGNLAETLENLADVLRRRLQMQLKIRAMSSEARASAYIIGALPFIMFAILMLMNPGYILTLFTDPRGLVVLGIGLTLMVVGALVMAKMVRFEI